MNSEEDTLFIDMDSRASSLRTLLPGRFIVLDGPDGCGKSTQMSRMKAFCLRYGIEMEHVREPGGTTTVNRSRTLDWRTTGWSSGRRCFCTWHLARS